MIVGSLERMPQLGLRFEIVYADAILQSDDNMGFRKSHPANHREHGQRDDDFLFCIVPDYHLALQ
jgi:hypothetical protein